MSRLAPVFATLLEAVSSSEHLQIFFLFVAEFVIDGGDEEGESKTVDEFLLDDEPVDRSC